MVTAVHAFDDCLILRFMLLIEDCNSYDSVLKFIRLSSDLSLHSKYSPRFDREWTLSNTEIEMYHFYSSR